MGEAKTREYKLRLVSDVEEATSANVTAWLEEALANDAKRLAPDPGAGAAMLSLRLDPEKVAELANRKRDRVPVLLRRLIATHAELEPAVKAEAGEASPAELLPGKVLPRKLSYEPEDFLDFIHAINKGMALLYRRKLGLRDLKAAETPEEDRKLAGALAEVTNRRSPAWLVANADLVKLGMTSFRWSLAQTEQLDAQVREARSKAGANGKARIAAETEKPETLPTAAQPQAASTVDAETAQHLEAPVQQEGEF
jgi:hypothetical protein